jgi:hypothetical protein
MSPQTAKPAAESLPDEPRLFAGYTDAAVYPVEFGRTELARLAAGGRVMLAIAGRKAQEIVGVSQQSLRGDLQTIAVTIDGWPGIFTLGPEGFFGTLGSANGNLMLQGNAIETLALDPAQLQARQGSQFPDYRHAPTG